MTMRDFAHHVISVAHQNDVSITNLQLQKVMYFTLKQGINEDLINREILEEQYNIPFVTWPYGPVVPDLYFEYNKFGSSPIVSDKETTSETFNELNPIILKLLDIPVFDLVKNSHEEEVWASREDGIFTGVERHEYTLDEVLA